MGSWAALQAALLALKILQIINLSQLICYINYMYYIQSVPACGESRQNPITSKIL